jgi:hypothetical protein
MESMMSFIVAGRERSADDGVVSDFEHETESASRLPRTTDVTAFMGVRISQLREVGYL